MAKAPRVLLLTDPVMAGHRPPGHAERPERLEAAAGGVADGAAASGATLHRAKIVPADRVALARVHPEPYLDLLDNAALQGGGWIDPDTYLGPESMMAARVAAGA
ncbi:MAG: histone deacetylase, partial [Chloroflexota bacterium]|nr:histone deacetylase [Chloroflexota bacterium]